MKFRIGIPTALTLSIITLSANAIPPDSLMYLHETWAGAYFGTYFGSGAGNVNTAFSENENVVQFAGTNDSNQSTFSVEAGSANLNGNSTGSVADLFVGYNFHPGWWNSRLIIGGQLEGNYFSDITLYSSGILNTNELSVTSFMPPIATTPSISSRHITSDFNDHLASMFTFIGRLGILATPNLLIYVLGGGVEGHFVLSTDEFFGTGDDIDKWQLGYTAGAGLEYRFNNNWSMRGEYRYIHFDVNRTLADDSSNFSPPDPTFTAANFNATRSFDSTVDFNMGAIGVVYRFDSFPIGK